MVKYPNMGKYLAIIKNSANSQFAYRADTITVFLSEALSFGVLFYIWFSIYRGGGQIGDYPLAFLIFYYAIGKIAGLIIENHGVAYRLASAISEGEFTNYILRPISIIRQEFSKYIGDFFYHFSVLSLVILFLLVYILKVFGPVKLLCFTLLSINSAIIFFFVFFLIANLAFFFQRIQGFSFLISFSSLFLAGKFVPLDVLPEAIGRVAAVLPFQYISFIPIMVFKNEFDPVWVEKNFIAGAAWGVLLFILSKIILNKGIKRYEAIGI